MLQSLKLAPFWSVPYYLCPLLPPITSLLPSAVVVPFVPLAEVVVVKASGPGLVREQGGDNAVLRLAFGAWDFRHGIPSVW